MPSANNSSLVSNSFDTDVLIAGAGPTGLTLAAALLSRGVRTQVVDRLAAGANTSRAAVVHSHTAFTARAISSDVISLSFFTQCAVGQPELASY